MEYDGVRRKILKYFKLNGFAIRAEAAARLAEELIPLDEEDRPVWMMKIVEKLQELKIDSFAVDVEHVEKCLEECTRRNSSQATMFNVISGFDVPSFRYDPEKCKFVQDDDLDKEKQLLPGAHMKSYILRRRYTMLLQSLQRKDLFKKQSFRNKEPEFHLTTAEKFLCTSNKIRGAVMFGLLVQRGVGQYELEDTSGAVKLDLSVCQYRTGLFVENCFVLVHGDYVDSIFYAKLMALPLLEFAQESREYFSFKNTFGGPSEISLTQSVALKELEDENPDSQIVFLADVWLDDHKVLKKLQTLFNGLAGCPPMAFVLFGNFLQQQTGPSYVPNLKTAFSNLADMIVSVPSISQQSYFVFVPGPKDPGSPLIYPRASLVDHLTTSLRQKIPKLIMATNPCRIQVGTREVVCMRADILTKMCRNVLHFPTDDKIPEHFAYTILTNGTLSPMSLYTLPCHWSYSNALDLYPLPDLVVVADQLNNFVVDQYIDERRKEFKCVVSNPGSFLRRGFHIYYPFKQEVDESHVPDDEET